MQLIKEGKAYVRNLSADEVRAYRGILTEPGKERPYRDRSVEENLDLFARMRAGEFVEGARVLRAKIDMASPNVNVRDPVMYRILHASHHRTGDQWCIYPMYDFAHYFFDSIEGIIHLEHHLLMTVPHYHLPRMHKWLRGRGVLEEACMIDGY